MIFFFPVTSSVAHYYYGNSSHITKCCANYSLYIPSSNFTTHAWINTWYALKLGAPSRSCGSRSSQGQGSHKSTPRSNCFSFWILLYFFCARVTSYFCQVWAGLDTKLHNDLQETLVDFQNKVPQLTNVTEFVHSMLRQYCAINPVYPSVFLFFGITKRKKGTE